MFLTKRQNKPPPPSPPPPYKPKYKTNLGHFKTSQECRGGMVL